MINEIISNANLYKLNLKNDEKEVSLKNVFVSVNIFEDIFSNFKTGKLILEDTNNIIETFPIVGGEEITIFFNTNNDFNKNNIQTYYIYKIEKDLNVQSKIKDASLVVIYFASKEFILNEQFKFSKKFNDTPNNIIQKIFTDIFKSKKNINFESNIEKIEFISNFWKPSEIFNYLTKYSKNKYHDFLFFENINGFNFTSLSELMSKKPTHELFFKDTNESLYKYNIIKSKTISKYFNDLELLKLGSFGNTYYQILDNIYGFNVFNNDFISATEKGTFLGKNVQNRKELSNYNNINITYKNSGEHLSYRSLLLKALSKYHMIVKLNGDSTKTVGQVFNLDIRRQIKDDNDINTLLYGNWFVTNINHIIYRTGYFEQNVKLIKNSFFNFKEFEKIKGRKNI